MPETKAFVSPGKREGRQRERQGESRVGKKF
jgi:hypothetical protein